VSNDDSSPPTASFDPESLDPDAVLRAALQISPDERFRLIASLWESMPPDFWPYASGDVALAIARQGKQSDEAHPVVRLPWPAIEELLAHRMKGAPPAKPIAKIYSAPRHFDLATLFAVTSAYSLLFGAMNGLQFPPIANAIVAGFITLVGIGQAVMYGGKQPRKASAVVGAVVYAVVQSVMMYVQSSTMPSPGVIMLLIFAQGLVMGALCGYIAGVMVGGVFLVADVLRHWFDRSRRTQNSADELEPAPEEPS
jgi:hypothetical protein